MWSFPTEMSHWMICTNLIPNQPFVLGPPWQSESRSLSRPSMNYIKPVYFRFPSPLNFRSYSWRRNSIDLCFLLLLLAPSGCRQYWWIRQVQRDRKAYTWRSRLSAMKVQLAHRLPCNTVGISQTLCPSVNYDSSRITYSLVNNMFTLQSYDLKTRGRIGLIGNISCKRHRSENEGKTLKRV